MATKKQLKKRNRMITIVVTIISGYIILVNNSLDFLQKFNISVDNVSVAFIGFIIILSWAIWKAQNGEL